MKYLLQIVLLGCFVLVADNSYSQAGATCEEEFIYDCFNPDSYKQPYINADPFDFFLCKTWTSGTINCPGTYYMAVYVDPTPGKELTYVSFESTCPGNVNVEILNGDQIESILKTFPPEQLEQLSVNEIREGKAPVFFRFKCYENGQGNVTFKLYCLWANDDTIPSDPYGGIRLLLLGDRNNK